MLRVVLNSYKSTYHKDRGSLLAHLVLRVHTRPQCQNTPTLLFCHARIIDPQMTGVREI
jgi:hypothetical protein